MPPVVEVMNTAVPCTRSGWRRCRLGQEQLDRDWVAVDQVVPSARRPRFQVVITVKTHEADREREPAAVRRS